MTVTEITELSAELLLRYYENDLQLFLEHCHEDILWLGPAKEQMIRTKAALVEAFGKEENPLRFTVNNLTAMPFHLSGSCNEVLLRFVVNTFWPEGGSNTVHQRITLTWEKDKIRVCHISNSIDYDVRDNIYPVHYLESHPQMTLYTESSQKLSFRGVNRSILYTDSARVMYLESTGNHTRVHLDGDSQCFACTERLSAIARHMPQEFLRCHSSYMVNPLHVQSIRRFSLTMTDGRKIPVPEKKYTAVKAVLLTNKQ